MILSLQNIKTLLENPSEDWKAIIANNKIEEDAIEYLVENSKGLMASIVINQDISEEFVKKHIDNIYWVDYLIYHKPSEEMLDWLYNKFSAWEHINHYGRHNALSDSFFKKHNDKNWGDMDLSLIEEDTLDSYKFKDLLYWNDIFNSKSFSDNFVSSNIHYHILSANKWITNNNKKSRLNKIKYDNVLRAIIKNDPSLIEFVDNPSQDLLDMVKVITL